MEFGKPHDPAAVDWTLPPDTPLTKHVLSQVAENAGPQPLPSPYGRPDAPVLYIGGTAWGQKDFVGSVYPSGTKSGDYLQAYGRQFNSIELNTTFYRVPDHRQLLKWYASVPDDFRFCPKVNNAITQAADLGASNTRAREFAKSVQHLEHKLGPCFAQLPPTFGTDRVDVLRGFLDRWPPSLRLAVELRHESWFDSEAGMDLFAELASRGIGAVITDTGGRRDAAHMHVTAPFTLVRWVGNVHHSDTERLQAWAQRLSTWMTSGLREAYVFTHQPEAVPSARAAAMLHEFWRKLTPPNMTARAPVLAKPALKPPDQPQLF